MAAVASHLADTSALARLHRPAVAAVLSPLIEAGFVATCGVIEFELGWATRSGAEFDLVRADRVEDYEWLATHVEDWHRALEVQGVLWTPGESGLQPCTALDLGGHEFPPSQSAVRESSPWRRTRPDLLKRVDLETT